MINDSLTISYTCLIRITGRFEVLKASLLNKLFARFKQRKYKKKGSMYSTCQKYK